MCMAETAKSLKTTQGKGKEEQEPRTIPSPVNNPMLNYRVYYMSAAERIFYSLLVFAAGGFAGWVFYGGLFMEDGDATMMTYISNVIIICLIGGIAVRVFLPALRKMLREKRDKALRVQFRDMLENLTSSLASGNTVAESFVNARNDLANQYSESDYIIQELTEIVAGINNGYTLEEMLGAFGERTNSEDIQNFSNVIGNCYRMGGDFKTVVRKTRDIISDKMAIEDEIVTKISSNKLQHNAMCLMPILLVAMLKMSSPSFAENLASFLGVLVTTAAVGIFVASYFWGRTIIDIR